MNHCKKKNEYIYIYKIKYNKIEIIRIFTK